MATLPTAIHFKKAAWTNFLRLVTGISRTPDLSSSVDALRFESVVNHPVRGLPYSHIVLDISANQSNTSCDSSPSSGRPQGVRQVSFSPLSRPTRPSLTLDSKAPAGLRRGLKICSLYASILAEGNSAASLAPTALPALRLLLPHSPSLLRLSPEVSRSGLASGRLQLRPWRRPLWSRTLARNRRRPPLLHLFLLQVPHQARSPQRQSLRSRRAPQASSQRTKRPLRFSDAALLQVIPDTVKGRRDLAIVLTLVL